MYFVDNCTDASIAIHIEHNDNVAPKFAAAGELDCEAPNAQHCQICIDYVCRQCRVRSCSWKNFAPFL